MNEQVFEPGDAVRLRGGGPGMTVGNIKGDILTCIWFDAKGHNQTKDFLSACLTRVDEKATFDNYYLQGAAE